MKLLLPALMTIAQLNAVEEYGYRMTNLLSALSTMSY